MNRLIIFILTLLPVLSYSQVTSINVDSSIQSISIINNGTMIENNGGTVNVVTEKVEKSVMASPVKSVGDLLFDWNSWSDFNSIWDLMGMVINYLFIIIAVDLFPILCIWCNLHDYIRGDKFSIWFYISIVVIIVSFIPLIMGINCYIK